MARQKTAFQFDPNAAQVNAAIASGDVVVTSNKADGSAITVKVPGGALVPVTRYRAVNSKGAAALLRNSETAFVAAINRFVSQTQDLAIRTGAEKPLEVKVLSAARKLLEIEYSIRGVEFDPKGNPEHKTALEARAKQFADSVRTAQ